MKRFPLPLIAALLILCSCGSAEAKEPAAPKQPTTDVQVITDWSSESASFDRRSFHGGIREITVNGRHCVETLYAGVHRGAGGISCDWDKGSSE